MSKKEAKPAKPEAEGAEGAEGDAPKKKGLPIMIIAAAGAVVLLGGGGAAAYFLVFNKPKPAAEADAHGAEAKDGHGKDAKKGDGKDKKKDDGHGKKKDDGHGKKGGGEKVDPKTQPVITEGPDGLTYFTLPPLVANIQSPDGKASFLKLKLTFEIKNHDTVELLSGQLPRINDVLQGFIRELRPKIWRVLRVIISFAWKYYAGSIWSWRQTALMPCS